jgi:hypothetical protein
MSVKVRCDGSALEGSFDVSDSVSWIVGPTVEGKIGGESDRHW